MRLSMHYVAIFLFTNLIKQMELQLDVDTLFILHVCRVCSAARSPYHRGSMQRA